MSPIDTNNTDINKADMNNADVNNADMNNVAQKANNIKLVIFDVDGVLSDGKLYYSDSGEELKAFFVQDGLGIKMLADAGLKTAIITGRSSPLVLRRAEELGISVVLQNRDDKLQACRELSDDLNIEMKDIAYIGDDLPDLSAIQTVGLGVAVKNACTSVKEVADYETAATGGAGAAREVCELILVAQNKFDNILNQYR